MENQRLIIFIALSFVVLLMYNAWQEQFSPKRQLSSGSEAPKQAVTNTPPAPGGAPANVATPPTDIPAGPASTAPTTGVAKPAIDNSALARGQRIRVTTDLLDVEIDTLGGDIRKASLLKFPENLAEPNTPVVLFNDELPYVLVAQSGLVASQGQSADHHIQYSPEQTDYKLTDNQDTLKVKLSWKGDKGLTVVKTYTFSRNSYVIHMDVELNNATPKLWAGRFYRQLQRSGNNPKDKPRFTNTFTGGIISNENNKYEKIKFDKMATWKPDQDYAKGGWVAMIQHYFLGAWIPEQQQLNNFYTMQLNSGLFLIGISAADAQIEPGKSATFSSSLYIGPKDQQRLAKAAPNLQLTVDYGVLTVLSEPIFWLLKSIHKFVNNWGWSIIFVTLTIKLLFYKLSEKSYRSMARLRKFQPKVEQIRERYGDDKQRMSQAMMDLYKKEKINPLGGCLPMLVQIPVFIALYYVLLESVELRQAPFGFGIFDLSASPIEISKEFGWVTAIPYFALPLIMGISMFVQQKLNPAMMDPMQAKIMGMLPIVFTIFFTWFPSGLVLYWVANNILSIIQQWYITRNIARSTN